MTKPSRLKEEYQNISDELFTVEVNAIGVSNITSNFDKMIQFDWDKLNLNVVKKYAHIYQELIKHGNHNWNLQLPQPELSVIECIISNIQVYLPHNYQFIRNEIHEHWLSKYRSKLNDIYQEDKFDLSWYECNSSDYKWALDRIKNIELHTLEIEGHFALFRDIKVDL